MGILHEDKELAPGVRLLNYKLHKSLPIPKWGELGLTLIGALYFGWDSEVT